MAGRNIQAEVNRRAGLAFLSHAVSRLIAKFGSWLQFLTYIQKEYTLVMRFTWDEGKRRENLKRHGFDFMDAQRVFDGTTFTFEDDRFRYDEERFVSLGLLEGISVSIVHTETGDRIHVISFRKATKRETEIFLKNL
jgi:hypothetical protein